MTGFALEILKQNKDRQGSLALIDRNGSREITWESLEDRVLRVAAYAHKNRLSGIVPVWMDRGMEAAATLLGLNLAGVGVAPLSITTPGARREMIASKVGNAVWTAETYEKACALSPAYELCREGTEARPAYVVFTSGSTGTPKGVMLDNRAILGGMMRAISTDFYGLQPGDRMLQSSSFSFIALVEDLLAPLYSGNPVYVLPEEGRGDPRMMADFVNRHGVNCLFIPPQIYRSFEAGPSLKCICTGSDKVVNLGPKGHRLVNVYGMTEMAGYAFHYDIREPMESTPIGEPCSDIRAYVLDEEGKEAEEGELCVSGAVAYGYFDQEELTQKVFTSNPFSDDPLHAVLLHTGDLVRRIPEGGFLYINRKDSMIKINGQRVEPGEIEAVMMDCPGIDVAAAKGFTDENQRSFICGYYTCKRAVDEEVLRNCLKERLPKYMVPAVFVKMETFPLNANGKLDRKALTMPDLNSFLGAYEAPRGEAEERICHAFEKALGIGRAGREDDFFTIGGDSIAALTVVEECASLGITVGDVFAGRTPGSIASLAAGTCRDFCQDLPKGKKSAKLTESQMGILLACGMKEACTKYNIPVHLRFERTKEMTASAVKAAVDTVIRIHPALYAEITEKKDGFYMERRTFPKEGLCAVSEASGEEIKAAAERFCKPIALGTDPLCEAEALLGKDALHVFLNMHHIVSDGSSVAVLAGQIAEALSGGTPKEETVDAFALSEAEERIRSSRAYEEAKTYYAHLLSGVETDSSLLPDHKGSEERCLPGERFTLRLDRNPITSFLEKTGITENTFFMGVFGYTLAKMTGQKESVFGAAENGRGNALLSDTVSMLVKTLPVVMDADEELSGTGLLKKLQSQFFSTMRNDCIGFGELTKDYDIRPDVMFVYQSDMFSAVEGPKGHVDIEIPKTGESVSNFNLMVLKEEEGFTLHIEYRADLYEEKTVRRFVSLYERAAKTFISGAALKEMVLITEEDRAFLDAENRANTETLSEETVIDLFLRSVRKYPDRPAITAYGRTYTYTQVEEISNRIAAYLKAKGIGRGNVVSVLIPRCEYMLIASMGIMKAGAAYQPLDPNYPEERLTFMMEDAKAVMLIKDRKLDHILSGFDGKVLYTDEIGNLPEAEAPKEHPEKSDVFVLLYTSGTTGKPKGVMLNHGNLRAMAESHARLLSIDDTCTVASYASYGFDAHMADIYPAVTHGGSVQIVPEEIRLDLGAVREFIETNHVTHIMMTTQVARQFAVAFEKVEGLRCVNCGGEKLVSFEPVQSYKFMNLYGPTEFTVCSSGFTVDRYYENIPIGKANLNTRQYVVDLYGRRVPVGVPGELVLGGPQVGVGYLGLPEQTERAFVPNTFENAEAPYDRCYRTGDIVRFIESGDLEFIGRRDHQIKIRGFRVELGEVEKAIRDYPSITDATVSVMEKDGAKNLCAYVVSDEKIDIEDLNRFIGQSHPAYMIPAVTMQIDAIPLNVNGKVDKKKLPAPELHFDDVKLPENEIQQKIHDCAAEAVGTGGFGIDTDLFAAGLSSIGSIRLCTLLAEAFDIPVKIRDLRKNATVTALEGFVRKAKGLDAKPASGKESGTGDSNTEASYGPAVPITKTMEGIFTECLQRPESTVYNIPYLLKLGKGIDAGKLKKAVVSAVAAHPGMMAELFTDEEGHVCEHCRLDKAFTEEDIPEENLAPGQDAADIPVRAFELTGSRLFEIRILHGESLYLFINIHHIISDGTSMAVFVEDVEKAYMGEEPEQETFTCFDVAREELEARTEEELEEEKNYYRDLLEGSDKDFLPLGDRTADSPEASGVLKLVQVEADARVIRGFCERQKTGMNAFFLSVFGTVLARYAGTDYSVFNTVYNGRNDSRTVRTSGMLVKTLPVVCHADRETVGELLADTSAQLMDSMSNDLYSYAEVSRSFGVRNDVMFIYQGNAAARTSFAGEPVEEISLGLSEAKTALSLQVMVREEKLFYELEYDPKRFTGEMAKSFMLAFDRAAASFVNAEKLGEVSLLSEEAEEEMERHNDTKAEYDRAETVTSLFLRQVKKHPGKLCVEHDGTRLNYGQVGELTAKLAGYLMKEGVGAGDVAAILINRNENMVITAHGVLRTGAAYLGLDPTYPAERLEFMIKDSHSKILIAERPLLGLLGDYRGKVICTDEIAGLELPSEKELEQFSALKEHRITPESDALIIYSSGTTGVPKGSVLRHRNIVCFWHSYIADQEIDEEANVAEYASFGFDGGAQDVLGVPMAGASLFVIPDEIRLDLSRLEQFYCKHRITAGFMTTQVGCMFVAATRCRSLRQFSVGGEKLIPVTGPDWVCFKNAYGPSETMCYVNKYTVHDTGAFQPIGKVSRNTKEYIIDRFGNRLPYGACGELCISGGQVGRGYLGRPEKTAEVFVKNRFSSEPGYEIMYRTGDVVRMLPDGNYDFVGRRDGQVKIRGFRVELGEIEQQIRKYPGVTNALVRACDNPAGGKFLAAYAVMEEKTDPEELKAFIGKEKPDYMVPAVIIRVEEIPLTSNGKVDMSALPVPEMGAVRKGAEPENETEETICRIFGEVLGISRVYADDDFFKIGGSSISAIQVVVKCEHAGFPVVFKNLFANPTPQKLAEFIHSGKESDVSASGLNKNGQYDYSALDYNVIPNLPKIRNDGVGDVLLTGATGFLGSHIFKELMDATPGRVICLVRSKDGLSADMRFETMMTYYFDEWYTDSFRERCVIIDGELEDADILEKLEKQRFDTVINCAANVKHFAVEDELMGANFSGVENLIRLAEVRKAKLIQISSISVCGESVGGSVPKDFVFKECHLNIGQSLENKYVYTKYLGEQAVIDAVSRGRIRGKIIRLGNLMARVEDSEFQVNAGSNALLRMFFGFAKLGCFPVNLLDAKVEFSPIDRTARAVVLLSGTPDEFTVFHARNCNEIHYSYLLRAVMDAGYPIEVVEDDVFEERLQNALKVASNVTELSGLLAYRNSVSASMREMTDHTSDEIASENVRLRIATSDEFTTKALYRLAFGWPLISREYLQKMVNVLVDLDFFER